VGLWGESLREAGDPSASVSLTVSSKFSLSAMMLRQFKAAIVPDDARRASDAV
jgi:hypothetical protein